MITMDQFRTLATEAEKRRDQRQAALKAAEEERQKREAEERTRAAIAHMTTRMNQAFSSLLTIFEPITYRVTAHYGALGIIRIQDVHIVFKFTHDYQMEIWRYTREREGDGYYERVLLHLDPETSQDEHADMFILTIATLLES